MFAALETPAAYGTLGFASVTLIWKLNGLDWLPILGAAFTRIFLPNDGGEDDGIAQYPRRPDDESFWHWVYLLMYGVFGTMAQFCGLLITRRKMRNRESLVLYARIYGAFHIMIGMHHLIWSLKKAYGKLELWRFHLPGVYAGTTLSALILIYHAYNIVKVNARTANLQDICFRKAVMDTSTCCTFISFVVFLVANILGVETSYETNQKLWALTMYLVPVILLLGFVMRPG